MFDGLDVLVRFWACVLVAAGAALALLCAGASGLMR